MKKRVLAILFATTIMTTGLHSNFVLAASEDPTEVSTTDSSTTDSLLDAVNQTDFSFRDIPWWSSKTDAEKLLVGEGAEIQQAAFQDNILRMSGIDYISTTGGKDRVDGGGIVARYSGLKVAGYTPSDTQACYIYTLNSDGSINKDTDSAQFYFGWYTFDSYDYADGEGIYNDLAQKLQSLYGDGTSNTDDDYFSTITWVDDSNNQIRLLLGGKSKDYKYVTLGYMAAGADEKLDEMQTAVDAENVANEASEREKNKEDVSGL